MMSSPRKRLIGLCLVASFLSMGAPAYATKPVVGSDVFPEPRVITIDRNLPEQSMSLEVQAAIRQERNQPRRDLSGRIHYMVDLVSDVTHGHSADTRVDQRLGDWHKPAMYSVTHAFEARYNLKATGMISWVGNGFSAYLTPEQLNALQRDPLVTQITEEYNRRWRQSVEQRISAGLRAGQRGWLSQRFAKCHCTGLGECRDSGGRLLPPLHPCGRHPFSSAQQHGGRWRRRLGAVSVGIG